MDISGCNLDLAGNGPALWMWMVKPSGPYLFVPWQAGKAEAVSRPKEVDENSEEVKTLRE